MCFTPTEGTYFIITEIPVVQPYRERGLSSTLNPTCQVRELNMSILHLAPFGRKKKGELRRCASVSPFSFFSSLCCTVIAGARGLHVYKSFIVELMHCTWRKSAHIGCNYSGWRYCVALHGKSLPVFLPDLHPMVNVEFLVQSQVFAVRRTGLRAILGLLVGTKGTDFAVKQGMKCCKERT